MKTIHLLMMIMLCQFTMQHDAIAQTNQEARAQAMIESLQEQRAQSEMNLSAYAMGRVRLNAERNGESSGGASDIVVALAGVSLVLVFGYLEWSDSSQGHPRLDPKSRINENVQETADDVKKPLLTRRLPRDRNDIASNKPRPAAQVAASNSDCDLMRYLVCQHAKAKGTVV